jgi:hypothetical protein
MKNSTFLKASARITAGLSTARDLRTAINRDQPEDKSTLFALCERLQECNAIDNVWAAEDLHSEATGELYESHGRFWECGSKLCPSCLAKQSQKHRKKLNLAIETQRLFVGENFYFVTMTMPNPQKNLLETRNIINRAWTLFRKLKPFRDKIAGGAKCEEFTFTKRGYHYHLHLVIRAKYLHFNHFRALWTQCLATAFTEAGIDFLANTRDGLALVQIKRLHDTRTVANEVCKYVTKSDSWSKIPEDDFLNVARIRRFPRMFELFGSFKDIPEEKTILDTRELTDAEKTERITYWRIAVEKDGLEAYLVRLRNEISHCIDHRKAQLRKKYPFATFSPLC